MISRLMTVNTERKKLIFLKERNKFVQTETNKLLFIAQEKQSMADKDRHVRLEKRKEETCWCIYEITNKHTPEEEKKRKKIVLFNAKLDYDHRKEDNEYYRVLL